MYDRKIDILRKRFKNDLSYIKITVRLNGNMRKKKILPAVLRR